MRRLLACLLIGMTLWLPLGSTTWAEDAPSSGLVVIRLTPGQPAPAQGYFLPDEIFLEALKQSAELRKLFATHQLELDSLREQLRRQVAATDEQVRIAVEGAEAKKQLVIDELMRREEEKAKEIAELRNPPWWKSREFYLAVGSLAGALITRGLGF
jgi:hypothetical protein